MPDDKRKRHICRAVKIFDGRIYSDMKRIGLTEKDDFVWLIIGICFFAALFVCIWITPLTGGHYGASVVGWALAAGVATIYIFRSERYGYSLCYDENVVLLMRGNHVCRRLVSDRLYISFAIFHMPGCICPCLRFSDTPEMSDEWISKRNYKGSGWFVVLLNDKRWEKISAFCKGKIDLPPQETIGLSGQGKKKVLKFYNLIKENER